MAPSRVHHDWNVRVDLSLPSIRESREWDQEGRVGVRDPSVLYEARVEAVSEQARSVHRLVESAPIYVYDDAGAIKHAYHCDTKEGKVVHWTATRNTRKSPTRFEFPAVRRLCRHVPRVSRRSSSIGSRAEATSTARRCRQKIRRNCWSTRSPRSRRLPSRSRSTTVRRLRYFVGRSGVHVRRHGSREQPVHRIHRLGAGARHIQRHADEVSERFQLAEVQVAGLRQGPDRHPAARHFQRHERDPAPRHHPMR